MMKKLLLLFLSVISIDCCARIEINEAGMYGMLSKVSQFIQDTRLYQYIFSSAEKDPIRISAKEFCIIAPDGNTVHIPWKSVTVGQYITPDPVEDKGDIAALKRRLKEIKKQKYITFEDAFDAPEIQEALTRVLGLSHEQKAAMKENITKERLALIPTVKPKRVKKTLMIINPQYNKAEERAAKQELKDALAVYKRIEKESNAQRREQVYQAVKKNLED